MNTALKKRLEKLEHILIAESFTVIYKDGHKEHVPPGDCILLVRDEEIITVEEFSGSRTKENGKMLDLLNGLLEKEM